MNKLAITLLALFFAFGAATTYAEETNRYRLVGYSIQPRSANFGIRSGAICKKKKYPKPVAGTSRSRVLVKNISRVSGDLRLSNTFLGMSERASKRVEKVSSPEVILATQYLYSDARR